LTFLLLNFSYFDKCFLLTGEKRTTFICLNQTLDDDGHAVGADKGIAPARMNASLIRPGHQRLQKK
jgi:hypothetical protein